MSFVTFDCVKQETTTAGTGDLLLGASLAGYFDFSARCASLDVFCYEVHAVDASGARTGAFETGIGQYWLDGASHKLRRLFKLTGSNHPTATLVDFAAGTKQVSITVTAAQAKQFRFDPNNGLQDLPVIYVRADGSDGNSGLADTAAQAFLTVNHAMDFAAENFTDAVISVGPGSFTAAYSGYRLPARISIEGAGAGTTTIAGVFAEYSQQVEVSDCTLADASGWGLVATGRTASIVAWDVAFGACQMGHAVADGGTVSLSDYIISGGSSSGAHIAARRFGRVICGSGVDVSANITLASGFVLCDKGPAFVEFDGATISLGGHTVTGKRYDIRSNSVCDTGGGGASFLPGTVSGTTAGGGEYL